MKVWFVSYWRHRAAPFGGGEVVGVLTRTHPLLWFARQDPVRRGAIVWWRELTQEDLEAACVALRGPIDALLYSESAEL